ncbi:MAG: TFIIB-type zinc ribbon-containing protein [Lachnospiraceae bacterium]|nr:TFIIB-type zinc ribbon-containing protein [Lachnospiraceae bacterium]
MYLKKNVITFLKIKNILLAIVAIANLIVATAFQIYLVVRYWGDTYTLMHARGTSEFLFWIIAGPIILIHVMLSSSNIGDARFYSGYFEGDLDGFVGAEDLAEVTGRSAEKITKQLKIFPRIYMKNYAFRDGGAELASKTTTCECLSCGGIIEKKIYFTGECPYCNSSDLRARVLTDGKYYSITNEVKGKPQNFDYYSGKNLSAKRVIFPILIGLTLFVMFICLMVGIDNIAKYNNHDYLVSIILDPNDHRYDIENIHYDMIYSILASACIIIGLIPVLIKRIRKISLVNVSYTVASYLTRVKTPFVSASKLPAYRNADSRKKINLIFNSLKKGYLRHCTVEKHGGVLQVALGKQIVKDRCPNCGGAIVGAADRDYICRYCGSKIMDVIVKK